MYNTLQPKYLILNLGQENTIYEVQKQVAEFENLVVTNTIGQREIDSENYLEIEQKQVTIPFNETRSKVNFVMDREVLSTHTETQPTYKHLVYKRK